MFHAVNGDRRGHGWAQGPGVAPMAHDLPKPNKGDRGFSDMTEARTFVIGTPSQDPLSR